MVEAATIASVVIGAVALYALAGAATALAFLAFGRMHGAAQFTIGARVLIFPGLIALWPVVIRRALAARDAR